VRQVSPDGKWLWDGKRWLPFTGPPAGPPRVSPDGKCIWDGNQWLPVARRQAVFPAWSVAAEQSAPAPEVVKSELAPIPVIGPEGEEVIEEEPAFNPYPYVEPAKPAWERPQTGFNKYLYIAAGLVVLVMAALVLNSLGPFQLPWVAQANPTPRPSPTPPLAARSDFALADRLLNGYLSQPIAAFNSSNVILDEECNGVLSFSCRDAMRNTDYQVKTLISVLGQQTAVSCIAAPVTKMRADLAAMDAGLILALKAYSDNALSELGQGFASYQASLAALGVDLINANHLQKTVCSPTVVGP
jgi:hypothetical protein